MNKYFFEGERIHLTEKDYYRMKDLYRHIDLSKELEQLDFELRDKRSWWSEMNAKLNYRNKIALRDYNKKQINKLRTSLEEDLTNRDWAN